MTTNYSYSILNEVAFEYDSHLQRVSKTVWQGTYWQEVNKAWKKSIAIQVHIDTNQVTENGIPVDFEPS
mgnify:CR=1 FL=1